MALDYKLILDELSKLSSRVERHFDAWEAKWDRRFTTSPATTASPAVADVAAAPDAPPQGADAGREVPLASRATSTAAPPAPTAAAATTLGAKWEKHFAAPASSTGPLSLSSTDESVPAFDSASSDLDAVVSNTASAESVGLHDVPVCDTASTVSVDADEKLLQCGPVDTTLLQTSTSAATTTTIRVNTFLDSNSEDIAAPATSSLSSVLTSSPAAAARGADEGDLTSIAPTKCSTKRLSGNVVTASRPRRAPWRAPRPRRPQRARLRVKRLRLPWRAPSPATSTSPATAVMTLREVSFLNPGSEDTTTPVTSSSASLSPPPAPPSPIAALATWLTTQPDAPACSQPPAACSAEVSASTDSPVRCSAKCLSCKYCYILLTGDCVIPKHVKPVPVSRMANSTEPSSTSMDTPMVIEGTNQRYITNLACAHFMAVVLLDSVTNGHDYQKVSKSMLSHYLVLPEFLVPSVVDIRPWPPPLKNKNIVLSDAIKLDFKLGLSFGSGQEVVKPKPPWLLPAHWVMPIQGAQFRPLPWPSFGWLLFNYHHDPVKWKLSWISVLSVINLLSDDLNGLKETIPSQARNPCNILQPPSYMPIIHWRDITIVSASSVWEVQPFHLFDPAVHIVALDQIWDMQFLFMVISFGLWKLSARDHGICDGGTSGLLRCYGHEYELYYSINKLDFPEVLNMDECCKHYMFISGMAISLWPLHTRANQQVVSINSSVPAVLATLYGVMGYLFVFWYEVGFWKPQCLQLSLVICSASMSTQQLRLWDPGGCSYWVIDPFAGTHDRSCSLSDAICQSSGLCCVLSKASAIVILIVICYSTAFGKSDTQEDKCWHATDVNFGQTIMHQYLHLSVVLCPAIISIQQLIKWDPGDGPKIKQELIMIINYWRFSLCIVHFYHQVVDDP